MAWRRPRRWTSQSLRHSAPPATFQLTKKSPRKKMWVGTPICLRRWWFIRHLTSPFGQWRRPDLNSWWTRSASFSNVLTGFQKARSSRPFVTLLVKNGLLRWSWLTVPVNCVPAMSLPGCRNGMNSTLHLLLRFGLCSAYIVRKVKRQLHQQTLVPLVRHLNQ